ncbi:MAG: hypothetical protein Q9170_003407 [Blastenia crenularia]
MGTERFYIDIAQVIIYALLLPIAIFVTVRHGLNRCLGFLYLCIFCGLRIASAGLGIASENSRNNRSNLVWNVNSKPPSLGLMRAVQILHFPNIIALALAVVGGVRLSSSSPSTQSSGKYFARAGVSIFMAIFLIYVILCILTWVLPSHTIARGEKCILYGILIATPFIFLRILYALLAATRDKGKFRILDGSASAQLGIGIIEEMIVVIVYVGTGIIAPVDKRVEEGKGEERGRQMVQASTG